MQQITIPGSNLHCSRFIFGTASLFSVGSAKKRRYLLDAAVDNGFTHFDTAPYYGFGMAERDLAPLLKSSGVTVTTKVGIYSPGGESQGYAQIFARKAGGRLWRKLSTPTYDFSVKRAMQALDGSLRRLDCESIDCYMLHEPDYAQVQTDEWLRWLEQCRSDGKVKAFGLALDNHKLTAFLNNNSPLCDLIQTTDSLLQREADLLEQYQRPVQITYGYVSAARQQGDSTPVPEILSAALKRNHKGAIIVSTKRPERTAEYARIVEQSR